MIEFNEDETTASSHAVSMSGESTCAALSHWTCIALSVRKPRGIGTTRYVILSERSRVFDNLFAASGPFFSSAFPTFVFADIQRASHFRQELSSEYYLVFRI